MRNSVLRRVDGIRVAVAHAFILDQPGFETHAFTPAAALDSMRVFQRRIPPPDRSHHDAIWQIISEDDYVLAELLLAPESFAHIYRAATGDFRSDAERFWRNEQLCYLLGRLTSGCIVAEDTFAGVRMTGKFAPAYISWQVSTLRWSTPSSEEPSDFASYISWQMSLTRILSWQLAWVLVRSTYCEDFAVLDRALALFEPSTTGAERPDVPATIRACVAELRRGTAP